MERVRYYLDNFHHNTALALARVLFQDHPSEERLALLAEVHMRKREFRTAYDLLKGAALPDSRYLKALCCLHLGLFPEAETALLGHPSMQVGEVPRGACGLHLLGMICQRANRRQRAVSYFRQALALDPYMFESLVALCDLGEDPAGSEVHADFAAPLPLPKREIQGHQSAGGLLHPGGATTSSFAPTSMSFRSGGPPSARNDSLAALQSHMAHRRPFDTPLHDLEPDRAPPKALNFDTPSPSPSLATPSGPTASGSAAPPPLMPPPPPPPSSSKGSGGLSASIPPGVSRTLASADSFSGTPIGLGRGVGPVGSVPRAGGWVAPAPPGAGDSRDVDSLPRAALPGRQLFSRSANEKSTGGPSGPDGLAQTPHAGQDVDKPDARDTQDGARDGGVLGAIGVEAQLERVRPVLAVLGTAYGLLCRHRGEEALRALHTLPVEHFETGWVQHWRGRAYFEMADYPAALQAFALMRQYAPHRVEGLELYSTALWQLHQKVQLCYLAQEASELDRQSPEVWCVVGNCFSLQKDHDAALRFFKRSTQLSPNFTYAYTLCGHEYVANEDFEKAIDNFRRALQSDPRHYNAWYGLGSIYLRQEKFSLAEYHYRRALAINPQNPVLYCQLGNVLHKNGKFDEALSMLKSAADKAPTNPQVRYTRAEVLDSLAAMAADEWEQRMRLEEALIELEAVRSAVPKEAQIHFKLGAICKKLGRKDEALKHFTYAYDLDPKDNNQVKSALERLDQPDFEDESF